MPPSSHIFYYTGNLQLKLESALSVWQKMFLEKHGELNFSRCNIDDTSPEQLFGELSTPPFLAAKRLTVVRIPAPAKSKEEPWERKKSEKIVPRIFPEYDESEYWKKLIKSIPEDHIVAFVGADYLPGLQKILLETATVKNFSVDSTWDKQDYAQKQLPLITQSHAALLITRVGEDMLLLENEIQKLSLLSTITERDILENTIESIDVKIFSITDAILAWNIEKSRELIRNSLSQFEKDILFLNSFLSVIRNVGLYAGFVTNGVSPGTAAEITKLKDFVAQRYRSIPMKRLTAFSKFYESLIQADILLKSGKLIGDDGLLHYIESELLKYNLALKGI